MKNVLSFFDMVFFVCGCMLHLLSAVSWWFFGGFSRFKLCLSCSVDEASHFIFELGVGLFCGHFAQS